MFHREEKLTILVSGNAAFVAGNYTEALQFYNQAIQLDPSDPTYHSNQAACHIKLKAWDGAVSDCDAGLLKISQALGPLSPTMLSIKSKLYWRKAVGLQNLGYLTLAIRTCNEGLLASDPPSMDSGANKLLIDLLTMIQTELKGAKLKSTASSNGILTQPVSLVEEFPESCLTESEIRQREKQIEKAQIEARRNLSFASTNQQKPIPAPYNFPPLPLSMVGLTQLLRTPKSNLSKAYIFFFSNVSPSSLPGLLGKAGVEPEVIDFVLDAIITAKPQYENGSESQWLARSIDYLDTLASCPRFMIALMFSSSSQLSAVKELLQTPVTDSTQLSSVLAKWK